MFALNRHAVAFLVVVETLVLAAAAVAVARGATGDTQALRRLLVLLVVGLAYAEIVDRVERFWIWLHTDRGASTRQAGVLLFAGVLVLPLWAALVQCAVVYANAVLRNRRHRTQPTYQLAWSSATVLLATMLASETIHALHGHISHPGAVDLLVIACTLVVYSGVNLVLLVSGMYLARRPISIAALLPNHREFGHEGAKLLLGVLGAVLVDQAPLLLPLIPMFAALLHRSALVRELTIDASTDAKTGLLTPKAWRRATGAELSRRRRDVAPIALMVLDLDHFKAVNDRFGHATGDKVLEAIGALLTMQLRANDVVGRYGGEEFVVLLPDTTLNDATEIADRLRRLVADLRPADEVQITVSIGVAGATERDIDIETEIETEIDELFASADAALYRAKTSGRDRVTVAPVA